MKKVLVALLVLLPALALAQAIVIPNMAGGSGFGFTGARITGTGTAPTCSSTGLGTGSAAIATGSTDVSGSCIFTPTGAPGTSGTMTLTFTTGQGAYGGNGGPICVFTLNNNVGDWNARATVFQATESTTAPTALWDNNAVALSAITTFAVNYHCVGR